jgi:hypothetical protein
MIVSYWREMPTIVRLVVIGQLTFVLISTIRAARWARVFFGHRGEPLSPVSLARSNLGGELLAKAALAGRLPRIASLNRRSGDGTSPEGPGPDGYNDAVRVAGVEFLYAWDRCHADANSARRASWLVFLLSLVMVGFGGFPLFFSYYNDGKFVGNHCLFLTFQTLLPFVAIGWSCSGVLYLEFAILERVLSLRRATWAHLCSRWQDVRNASV